MTCARPCGYQRRRFECCLGNLHPLRSPVLLAAEWLRNALGVCPVHCKMLDRARSGRFAYPAINVTSLTTANALLKGLADSKSDGIIQVSTGGGAFASGTGVKDMALGAVSIAEHVHRAAARPDRA